MEESTVSLSKRTSRPRITRLSGMQNDNPQKKSLLVTHKNLEKVYFRAYAVDLLNTIETSNDYSLLPSGRELDKLMAGTAPVQQWETPLPATPDYRMHKTFVVPPLKNTGTYLIVASGRAGFREADNRIFGMYLTVGDLVLVTRQEGTDAEVTVLSGSSGKAVAGAEVMLYRLDWNRRHQRVESKLSDERGIVQFRMVQQNSQYFLVARKGDQIAFDPQHLYANRQHQPEDSTRRMLFTDRSIYRPLQKVFWKAVLYRSSSNRTRFETSPASTFVSFPQRHQRPRSRIQDRHHQQFRHRLRRIYHSVREGTGRMASGKLHGGRGIDPGGRIQAADVRGQNAGSGRAAAAQPAGPS